MIRSFIQAEAGGLFFGEISGRFHLYLYDEKAEVDPRKTVSRPVFFFVSHLQSNHDQPHVKLQVKGWGGI